MLRTNIRSAILVITALWSAEAFTSQIQPPLDILILAKVTKIAVMQADVDQSSVKWRLDGGRVAAPFRAPAPKAEANDTIVEATPIKLLEGDGTYKFDRAVFVRIPKSKAKKGEKIKVGINQMDGVEVIKGKVSQVRSTGLEISTGFEP